jgi:tight adherence protein B
MPVGTSAIVGALIGAGIGAGVLLLIAGFRPVAVDESRPPGRLARTVTELRSPAVSGRLAGGVAVAVGTLVLTGWPVAAIGLGALVVGWPGLFGGTRAEQNRIMQLEALAIWTESLRDTITAHASLERAIPASTEHAPPPIRPALTRLAGQIRVRAPLDQALLRLADDLDDPSADLVIGALILNVRRRGDQLAQVLTGLASTAREELDLRRKISAGRAGLRRGVQIVVLLTVGFALYLTVFSREYVQPYSSPAGQVALAVVVGMFATGFAWMRSLSSGRAVQPFLARTGVQIRPADVQVVAALTGRSDADARRLSGSTNSAAELETGGGVR